MACPTNSDGKGFLAPRPNSQSPSLYRPGQSPAPEKRDQWSPPHGSAAEGGDLPAAIGGTPAGIGQKWQTLASQGRVGSLAFHTYMMDEPAFLFLPKRLA